MELSNVLLIVAVGFASGVLNVLAGGGSLLTLPVLLELGFTGPLANGTVRVGILAQNLAAMASFQRGGERVNPTTGWLVAATLPGAALGAFLGTHLEGAAFRFVLASVMVGVWAWMLAGWLRDRRRRGEAASVPAPAGAAGDDTAPRGGRPSTGSLLLMVGVGLYGGFLQAGVGFLFMAVVNRVLGENLVRTNAHKVWVVASYTVVALGVFAWRGAVDWHAGIALALGTMIGGALGARLTLRRGETLVRAVFSLALVALVVRLLWR